MPDPIAPVPETTVNLPTPGPQPNEDDALLNDGAESTPATDDDEEEPETPSAAAAEEEDEEEEDKDEGIEPTKILFDRPTVKEIKEKFPEFFKTFPELKDAFFREIEYTKLFPTVEEAKEAFEDNEAFSNLSDAALGGDPKPLLESIEKTDKEAFRTFAAAFLPVLYKQNQDTYHAAVTPLFENLVRQLYHSSDENMKNTGINVAQFLFGDDGEDIAAGKKTLSPAKTVTEEQKALATARAQETSKAFRGAYDVVATDINTNLKAMILKDFDPNKVFTKFLRGQLADECIKRIMTQLQADKAHNTVMAARWKRAKSNGYTNDDKSKIVSTFLARAKSLVNSTRDKVRADALGTAKRGAESRTPRVERPEVHGGRAPSHKPTAEAVDYKKMSDLQILELE